MAFPQYRQTSPVGPITLVGPGFRGLNTELTTVSADVDQQFALDLREWVFDEVGTISLRKGWTTLTSTAMTGTPDVVRVFEYLRADGTATLVAQTDAKFWVSTDDGATWTDVTGALAWSAGKTWMFVNFNDKIIAAAPGEFPVVYNGSGNFTAITAASGAVPVSNGVILSAYGRLWIVEDATGAIVFTALLDETRYAEADGGGAIDVSNVWTLGTDEVHALRAVGATFVVLGRRHVVMYVDGAGSEKGIDPDNMYVVDTIENVGCISRDAVVQVGEGDLWFMGPTGVHSLSRIVADKTNPLVSVTRWVDSMITTLVANEPNARYTISAVWCVKQRFALFLFGANDKILLLDTRYPVEDGTARIIEWRAQTHTCIATRRDHTILFGRTGGKIAYYNGYRDDTTGANTTYTGVYASPWIDGGTQVADKIKLPKRVTYTVLGRETLTVVTQWGFNYRGLSFSYSKTSDFPLGSEFAIGEWNEAEWSGGVKSRTGYTPLCGNGSHFKIAFEITSTDVGDRAALKQMVVHTRVGRRA